MNEQKRLQELDSYQILDTPPDPFLDELVELASLIFNTPISLITLIDENREFYKAVKGLETKNNVRANSFCQHTIHNPNEVLTVPDTLKDPRFKNNPLVQSDPKIRFYAGAPLETPNGNVLGTLCVIDTEPREIAKHQEQALKILARKAMDHLNIRKKFSLQDQEISTYTEEILKLTDELPGVIYQFRISKDGEMTYDFFSKGMSEMFPGIKPDEIKENPVILSTLIPEEDWINMLQKIQISFDKLTPWEVEFRVVRPDGSIIWHRGKATPRKQADGSAKWCGFFHNITSYKKHDLRMKQIAFDISHVIRKPVTTLLSLTALIEEEKLTEKTIKEYSCHIRTISEELDQLTIELDKVYQQKVEAISEE